MKPYYEQDGITIYNADCREVLPTLAPVDLVLTDPPYGVSFEGKATKHTTKKSGGYTTDDSSDIGPDAIRECLPMSKRAAVFPGTRNLFKYPPADDIGCVYCPSGAGIGRWGFTCFHPVLFYGKRASNVLKPSSIQSFAVSGANGHPCPKPIEWMNWLVNLCSVDDDTILDPFAGSGTTLVAAKLAGRKAIGIEIEEKYCEIAANRLAQGVLFGAAV